MLFKTFVQCWLIFGNIALLENTLFEVWIVAKKIMYAKNLSLNIASFLPLRIMVNLFFKWTYLYFKNKPISSKYPIVFSLNQTFHLMLTFFLSPSPLRSFFSLSLILIKDLIFSGWICISISNMFVQCLLAPVKPFSIHHIYWLGLHALPYTFIIQNSIGKVNFRNCFPSIIFIVIMLKKYA